MVNYRVTSVLVAQVIRYTVATSALTSLLILACLFAYFAAPLTFIYIALHFSSGRTYANAVLVNLNARRKLREALESMEPSFAKSAELRGISSAIRRIPRLGDTSTHEQSFRAPTNASRSMTGGNKLGPILQFPENVTHPPRSRYSLP
ncbi:hypothetical protein D9756_002580 [Leucocoprinus leucothites]|uniref:DUF6534 domain-containing protein n=1 Tax=Leucocoprinus leucothites TaxID=201217 RepID=A0A8H5LM55_9AGAR|nr:hypothetical protein D9756_002580 [Leucoagaricus leucothites]